jgi:hypothetical protein
MLRSVKNAGDFNNAHLDSIAELAAGRVLRKQTKIDKR